jgi:redox-sensitive bicupin YhaK (pirin superfamily)
MERAMRTRTLQRLIPSIPASDGAGVKLRRSIGKSPAERIDPFLMLDEFFSDNPDDYLAGFPDHPHRGFETVTYMLEGHMLHQDHLGNRGDLNSGDVQWMTAGRGIIHSEMPQQTQGRMRGFQLWINLPAREKMKPAGYRDIPGSTIPQVDLPGGGRAKVIAGTLTGDGRAVPGPVQGLATDPLYLDITLPAGAVFVQPVNPDHNAFVYVYEGAVDIGPALGRRPLRAQTAGLLSPGERIEVAAREDDARFLLLAGKPLREPIAQYGPFVMNTHEEIGQAIQDYQSGRFASKRDS